MLTEPTLFILGAGAHADLNMPVGTTLREDIHALTQSLSDPIVSDFQQVLLDFSPIDCSLKELLTAIRFLSSGISSCNSIDELIDSHRSNIILRDVAKIAITFCIMEAERTKCFFKIHHNKISLGVIHQPSWYAKFFNHVFRGVQTDGVQEYIESEVFRVLTFNYDRCFEAYLALFLSKRFGMLEHDIAKALDAFPIKHIYGSIGPISIAQYVPGSIPFGVNPFDIQPDGSKPYGLLAWSGLRTIHESIHDSKHLDEIHEWICQGGKLVMCGCAFHRQNFELLFQTSNKRTGSSYFGCCDWSQADWEEAEEIYKEGRTGTIPAQRFGGKAEQFFNDISARLV